MFPCWDQKVADEQWTPPNQLASVISRSIFASRDNSLCKHKFAISFYEQGTNDIRQFFQVCFLLFSDRKLEVHMWTLEKMSPRAKYKFNPWSWTTKRSPTWIAKWPPTWTQTWTAPLLRWRPPSCLLSLLRTSWWQDVNCSSSMITITCDKDNKNHIGETWRDVNRPAPWRVPPPTCSHIWRAASCQGEVGKKDYKTRIWTTCIYNSASCQGEVRF